MSVKSFVAAASLADLPVGGTRVVDIGGRSILLCRPEDRIFAVINRCSHADEKLECGRIRSGWIACRKHCARFDLATGRVLNAPATLPIEVFAVRISGDTIEVEA